MVYEKYYLFFVLALLSEIVGTVSGFGSSILFVPVASMFFDFKTVLAITAVFHVFSNLSKIVLFRKGVDKNIVVKLGISAVIFVLIGAALTTIIPVKQLELLMSLVLIGLSVYLIINFNKTISQTNTNLFIGGAASGFIAGLAGTGGAIRGIVLAAFNLHKEVFIATSALIDLGVDSGRAFIYIKNGYFKMEFLILVPVLFVVGLLGSYLGKLILKHTSETIFRYLVLIVIILTSVVQVSRYFLS